MTHVEKKQFICNTPETVNFGAFLTIARFTMSLACVAYITLLWFGKLLSSDGRTRDENSSAVICCLFLAFEKLVIFEWNAKDANELLRYNASKLITYSDM
jgi:hypothetical protein